MMEGKLLLPEEILNRWAELSPMLDKFLEHTHGEMTAFDIAQECINLRYQCWVVEEDCVITCVVITRIENYHRVDSLHILGISGSGMKHWQHFHSTLELFAKANNCTKISQWGRPGWARVLKGLKGINKEEYRVVHTVMAMELIT